MVTSPNGTYFPLANVDDAASGQSDTRSQAASAYARRRSGLFGTSNSASSVQQEAGEQTASGPAHHLGCRVYDHGPCTCGRRVSARRRVREAVAGLVSAFSGSTRRKLYFVGIFLMFVAMIAVVLANLSTILGWMEAFAEFSRKSPILGSLFCVSFLFLTAFPPMMGYSTMLYLTGYIFGFPLGFIPAFMGALSGACACFLLSRHYFQEKAEGFLSHYTYAQAIRRTVEKRGLRLLVLIRVAPYPYNVTNVLLATTTLRFRDFVLATAISLPKVLVHVYLGASLSSFLDVQHGIHASPLSVAMLVIGSLLGIGIMVYIWRHVNKIVQQDAAEDGPFPDEEELRDSTLREVVQSGSSSSAAMHMAEIPANSHSGSMRSSTVAPLPKSPHEQSLQHLSSPPPQRQSDRATPASSTTDFAALSSFSPGNCTP